MGWKSNQVQRLSVGLLTLFIASLDASQNSVNQSIKKHQSTFENVAMDIWDLAKSHISIATFSNVDWCFLID